jgi:hypothetical protein
MLFHQKAIVDYKIADSLNIKMLNLVLRSEIQLQAVNKLFTTFSIND